MEGPNSEPESLRTRLDAALDAAAADVAEGVIARLGAAEASGRDAFDRELLDTITRTDVEATRVLGRWIAGGEGATREEMDRLGAPGRLVDRLSLASLVKAYLAWRDVTLAVFEREATRVGAPEQLREEVRQMIARSCDASLVSMSRRFDQERRRLQDELTSEQGRLARIALQDSLTGLANRRLLSERLGRVLRSSERDGAAVAVCFVDLDGFKTVNDALGHDIGDQLLRALAKRLERIVRPTDTIARVGGDEFVVLCERIAGREETIAVAERILEQIREPFPIDGHELLVSASVGIAFGFPGAETEQLLACADAAMYLAKQRGGSRYELYEPEIGEFVSRRARLSHDLRRALQHGELSIHYQPIAAVGSMEVLRVEALARWRHATLGTILPAEFIPLAEQTGMVRRIDRWVLERACRQAASWQAKGLELGVSVNVALGYADALEMERTVCTALRRSGLRPDALTLEITESSLISDLDAAMQPLVSLAELGVRVAIDDFGVGYSSLSYLEGLPVDALKVDRSFIHGLTSPSQKFDVVAAIVELAHTLDLRVVAEGIETAEELALVEQLGCDEIQGTFLGSPRPHDEIAALSAAPPVEGPARS